MESLRNDGKGSIHGWMPREGKGERTNDRKENAHSERYHGANGGREIVEGRFKDSNRTARQTKQNRAEPGIN